MKKTACVHSRKEKREEKKSIKIIFMSFTRTHWKKCVLWSRERERLMIYLDSLPEDLVDVDGSASGDDLIDRLGDDTRLR